MTGKLSVHQVAVMTEGDWSFRTERPTWQPSRWAAAGTFDPFPAYPHDLAVIEEGSGTVSAPPATRRPGPP